MRNTSVEAGWYHHMVEKVPCLEGGDEDWGLDIRHFGSGYFHHTDVSVCADCGREKAKRVHIVIMQVTPKTGRTDDPVMFAFPGV